MVWLQIKISTKSKILLCTLLLFTFGSPISPMKSSHQAVTNPLKWAQKNKMRDNELRT